MCYFWCIVAFSAVKYGPKCSFEMKKMLGNCEWLQFEIPTKNISSIVSVYMYRVSQNMLHFLIPITFFLDRDKLPIKFVE